jgi:hypothetical protein
VSSGWTKPLRVRQLDRILVTVLAGPNPCERASWTKPSWLRQLDQTLASAPGRLARQALHPASVAGSYPRLGKTPAPYRLLAACPLGSNGLFRIDIKNMLIHCCHAASKMVL